jgi:hypothetical protein
MPFGCRGDGTLDTVAQFLPFGDRPLFGGDGPTTTVDLGVADVGASLAGTLRPGDIIATGTPGGVGPPSAVRSASSPLVAGWGPVWFGGRCSPAKGRGVVDQSPGSASNHRPGVICAMK